MRAIVLLTTLMLSSLSAWADSLTITSNNSSLRLTRDDPIYTSGSPSDPTQLLRTLEWTVDGRRILVYPSNPAGFLDVGHFHIGAHVGGDQIHAQGPMLGFATGATTGSVTGGAVYTVEGGGAGTGISRLWEKVDLINKGNVAVTISLAGLGYRPSNPSAEVPNLTGLTLSGKTVAFIQGITGATSLTDPPFGPVTVLPIATFSAFNPFKYTSVSLPAGATLTMVSEMRVGPPPLIIRPDFLPPGLNRLTDIIIDSGK